jgi:hypothetical protein
MSRKTNALFSNLLDDLDWAIGQDVEDAFNGNLKIEPAFLREVGPSCAQTVAARSLINSFYKKNIDEISPQADQAALAKFLSANNCCRDYQGLYLTQEWSWNEELVNEFVARVHHFFTPLGELSLGAILDKGSVGPGSNIGAVGTDYYSKIFSSHLSTTNSTLYQIYKLWASESDRYSNAEELRISTFGECSLVEGNKLSFVPKTRAISRTICSEPTLNMYFQQGLGASIEDRLREVYSIDLSTQPDLNRVMASHWDCRAGCTFATIDLASASDTISLRLLNDIMPRAFLGYLKLFRSPFVTLPGGESTELFMVSSMGNGFTFPLQTALFSCMVDAVHRCRDTRLVRNKRKLNRNGTVSLTHGNFGVFGDDIIVSNVLFADTCYLLQRCGFQVNEQKSFNQGVFRESCGSDYWCGQNVRGVYVKSLLTVQLRYSLLNRLIRWSAEHNISLPLTIGQLADSVPKLFVPAWESDDSGIKTSRSFIRTLPRDPCTQSVQYRRWVNEAPRLEFGDNVIKIPKGEKARHFNENGAVLCLLRGSLGGGGKYIVVRQNIKRYRLRTTICPNWNWLCKLTERERQAFETWSRKLDEYLSP